jgi:hypothetical protein
MISKAIEERISGYYDDIKENEQMGHIDSISYVFNSISELEGILPLAKKQESLMQEMLGVLAELVNNECISDDCMHDCERCQTYEYTELLEKAKQELT